MMRSCSRCMVVWPLAKYNVVVALTALPSRCDTNDASLSLSPTSPSCCKKTIPDRQTHGHGIVFASSLVKCVPCTNTVERKRFFLFLQLLGFLGWHWSERASGGYHPRNRRSRHLQVDPAWVGRRSGIPFAKMLTFQTLCHCRDSERASDRRGRRMNGLSFSFPTLPSPKYPSQIQPATAAPPSLP